MKNEYVVDWTLLKQWTYESRHAGIRKKFFLFWCIMALLFAPISILGMINETGSSTWLGFVMVLYCVYRAFVYDIIIAKNQYKRIAKLYGKASWIRSVEFTEEYILVIEGNTKTQYKYSDIIDILEDNSDLVKLVVPGNAVIRLYRKNFIGGTWKECRAILLSQNSNLKTGEIKNE